METWEKERKERNKENQKKKKTRILWGKNLIIPKNLSNEFWFSKKPQLPKQIAIKSVQGIAIAIVRSSMEKSRETQGKWEIIL